MSGELETAAGLAVGGLSAGQKADLSGQPCRNCGVLVEQRYCGNCGQLAASFHRPIWSLIGETLGDTLALDGRLSRTMPLLLFRPGRLTQRYTAGARARYVPPFRLFLLASLLFFFSVFAFVGNAGWIDNLALPSSQEQEVTAPNTEITANPEQQNGLAQIFDENGDVDRVAAKEALADGETLPPEADAIAEHAFDIVDDPRLFLAGLEKWSPRLSLLLVPMTILSLAILHFWRRKLYIYDHAIHALHLHSWLYITATLFLLLLPLGGGWLGLAYGVAVPVYVCRSLMVTGSTGVLMASWRTISLLFSWVVLVFIATVTATVLSAIEM